MARTFPFTLSGPRTIRSLVLSALAIAIAAPSLAQCPSQLQVQNFSGVGRFTCPCFVTGEQAAAILDVPAADYPIEILRVGIGWGSQFGGTPASLEEAIHIYAGGLPDPAFPSSRSKGRCSTTAPSTSSTSSRSRGGS